MFRLVPDQIRIAAGWVRCGQCGQVFNASAHMLPYEPAARPATPPQPSPSNLQVPAQPAPPAPPSPPPPSRPVIHVRRTPPAGSGTEQVVAAASPPKTVAAAPEPPPAAAAPTDPMPPSTANSTPKPLLIPPPATPATPASPLAAPDSDSAPASSLPPPDTASDAADEADDELHAPPTLFAQTGLAADWPAPSFVAQARRRALWASRPVQRLLQLALLLLLAALALQMALSGRDWLAAREPRLAPALRALCAPLGCGIQPYRRLDAIVIDGSSFKRAEGGGFRFSVTLHNASDLPVASPALELTLTDGRDRPLVRRVLASAELGAPPTLAAHGEFSGVSALTVSEDANPGAITGYFLTAFYP